MPSMFNRVTRYRASAALDPRENRLTEVFAAVLERVDGLGQELVSRWLDRELPDGLQLEVSTQRATAGGFFVDLELRFRDSDGDRLVCWVENKHGASLHGSQLEEYMKDLRIEAGEDRYVILLAPRDAMPEAPERVFSVTWQDTASYIDARDRQDGEVDQWLLAEFRRFLREEGLVESEALNTSHALFLGVEPEARRTLTRLHELADEHLERDWGPRSDGSSRGRDLNFWSIYGLAPEGQTPADSWGESDYLEWTLRPDFRPDADGGHVYCAGVTFYYSKQAPHKRGDIAEWVAARRSDGFEYRQDSSGYWRLWRFLRPEALLAQDTLAGQASVLSDWVLRTFRDAVDSPPRFAA